MRFTTLEEPVIDIAHSFRTPATDHDLEIDMLETLILKAMNNTCWTRDAFPGTQSTGYSSAASVLDEDSQVSLEHKEHLLDLMRMCCVALSGRHAHDA